MELLGVELSVMKRVGMDHLFVKIMVGMDLFVIRGLGLGCNYLGL